MHSISFVIIINSNLQFLPFLVRSTPSIGDTESIASDIAPLPNPPVYMPYSGTYNTTSHGYQPIQYGCTDRHISSGKCFLSYCAFAISCHSQRVCVLVYVSTSTCSSLCSPKMSVSQSIHL